jgi:hypothetical protein
MSKDAAVQFFQSAKNDPQLQLCFRSITAVKEFLTLGERNGYSFSAKDLADAASTWAHSSSSEEAQGVPRLPDTTVSPISASRILHHEWCLDDLPGLSDVVSELPNLKIRPRTVDIAAFHRSFRQDDHDFADVSPASPTFRARHNDLMKSQLGVTTEFGNRSFHLINLDEHVEHEQYDEYFRTKTRVVSALERFFGDEIRFSGSMWYPPNSYRAWHTNETQPGWRMYLIDFDGSEEDIAGKSFFRYMNPQSSQSSELITLYERPRLMRCFKIEQAPDKLLWHCIVNNSSFSRWSFGFMVTDSWMNKLL